jgi:hypothetical protein
MVVYQTESKIAWLGLDDRKLKDPSVGPVSAWASRNLVEHLLVRPRRRLSRQPSLGILAQEHRQN